MISNIIVTHLMRSCVQLNQVGQGQYPLGFSLLNEKKYADFSSQQSQNPTKNLVIYHI